LKSIPETRMDKILLFIQLTRPLFLLGPAIGYAMGVGIAHYLGYPIDWLTYLLGQAWVTLLQLSSQYLNEYFNAPIDQVNQNRTFLSGGSGALGPGKLPRSVAQFAALTCLAFLASLTVVMISRLKMPVEAYVIMGLAFTGAIFYSTPPVRLEASGYGELSTSVLVAFLVPAFAYLLQVGEMHRLVAMAAFPTFAAHMAMLLALELPDYANDEKFEKRNLMIRLGWQNGMTLHNALILLAFVLFLVAFLFGYPWFATLAGLLTLPVGLFQFWQMRSVALGGRTNWTALVTGGVAFFALMVYLQALAFWTN
jgi:1,4-dihydroxy-2-naphthoate polyprenyltransferase